MKQSTILILALSVLALGCNREKKEASVVDPPIVKAPIRCAELDGSLPTSHGKFSGDPEAVWLTENPPDRRMCLMADFTFTDPAGKEWRTPANYKVDGASIPRALWAVVGSPYTGDYRRASIAHDKACDDAQGDQVARRAADRMFFHASRAGGCSVKQATILYLGVRIGAWSSSVAAWKQSMALESGGPRVELTGADQQLISDFQRMAKIILAEGETDDPAVLEARTDRVASAVLRKDMRVQ